MSASDWVGLLVGGGCILLCIVLGIMLMRGHGLMLISGYNTMSPEERAKYNGKAIGKAVGAYMIALSLLIVAMIFCAEVGLLWAIWVGIGVSLVGTVALIVFLNKDKRFRNEDRE